MDANDDGKLSLEELKTGFGVLRWDFSLEINFWSEGEQYQNKDPSNNIFSLLGIIVREFSRPSQQSMTTGALSGKRESAWKHLKTA